MKDSRGVLHRLLRAVRFSPDRAMHSFRHRRALSRLRSRDQVRSVLVICYGNICRSPFAAVLLSDYLAPAGVEVASAGLYGPGRPSPREAREAASIVGIDLSSHTSKLVNRELAARADVIVVMDKLQERTMLHEYGVATERILWLGDFDPMAIGTRHIFDPDGHTTEVFSEVYSRIRRCAMVFVAEIGRSSGSASAASVAAAH